jgi:CTP synthase (UTP-ammonia lyase)
MILAMTPSSPPAPPRLALVGDRSVNVAAHDRIPIIVEALSASGHEPIELYWLHSTTISGPDDVAGFDGVWAIPGSPYANPAGVIAAIEAARTRGIPFLGTCGGFQHQLLEYARHVCGLTSAENCEQSPDAAELLIVPLRCSLFGEEASVTVVPDTTAARLMGPGPTTERFFCRFGLNPAYEGVLTDHGLVLSGRDEEGDARIAELPGHVFFVGSLFQPELASDATWVHPLIAGFAAAVRAHASSRQPVAAGD